MIVIDVETFDPGLHTLGDGSVRGDGVILCVGLYDGHDYVNCTPDDPRLKDWLASDESKCYHNASYDLSWLMLGYKFRVNGVQHDSMTRATLIDEYADLDLESCCKRFNVAGKNAEDTIEKWFDSHKKQWGIRGDVWSNADVCWGFPEGRQAMIDYNRQDCIATYNLFKAQEPFMEGIENIYQMECDLVPIFIEMKKNGIKIDTVERDRLTALIHKERDEAEVQLKHLYGITKEIVASPKKMTVAMNELGIKSPVLTPTGGQSWGADVLDLIDHPVIGLIQACKNYTAILTKGLEGPFVKNLVGDRIHTTFTSTKRDEGGTITGRCSSRMPNLQQVSARTEKHGQKSYGQEIRSIFIADIGYMLGAADYNAIEAVLLAHYAVGPGAELLRELIRAGADYHKIVMDMTGIQNRDVVKRMNYGFIYGMGINKLISTNRLLFRKLAIEAGMDMYAYGKQVADTYHQHFPIIRSTMRAIEVQAKIAGFVMSLSGRRHHKPRPVFENGRWNDGLYKITNHLIQGSASDIMKLGLIKGWKDGVFNVLKINLTVHDEFVFNTPYNKEGTEAAVYFQHECMEAAYKNVLKVPLRSSMDMGPTWGSYDLPIYKDMQEGRFNYEKMG
jgi:DNA polymerase-1